jgi:hypothetical protein
MSPTPPTVIKANTPADMLALVPHLVGYFPRNSLVMMMFDGRRTCGAIRIDIPTVDSTAVLKRFANVALGTVTRVPGVIALVPVIFTDDSFGDDSLIPHTELMEILQRRIGHMGYEVREALCQAADGWASYLDPRSPRGGRPLSDISTSAVNDNVPPDVRAKTGDHLADASYVVAIPESVEKANEAMARLRTFIAAVRLSGKVAPEIEPMMDIPFFAEWILSWEPEDLQMWAPLFLFAIQGPPMRDHIMLQWATNLATGERLFDAVADYNGSPESLDEDLFSIMLGKAPQPDPKRLERGVELLRILLQIAEDQYRPAPLCMLAWLNWALGRLSHAHVYIDEALRIDPSYGMALLLNTIVESGMLPKWAFEKRASVRPR